MKNKIFTYVFIFLIILTIFSFTLVAYVYDPLQLFHKPFIREKTFHANMRQQAFGIMKNYKFDSIIIGSSMLENTSSKEVSEKLGGTFINISLAGSDYFERNIILKYALKNYPIQKVIQTLDWYSHHKLRKGHPTYPAKTYNFLYNDSQLDNIKIYNNRRFFKCFLYFSDEQTCVGNKINFDRLNEWYNKDSVIEKYGGVNKWSKYKDNGQIKESINFIRNTKETIFKKNTFEKRLINTKIYLNETIIEIVKRNKNTEFIFIVPPYFRAWYSVNQKYNKSEFEIHKFVLKYLVEKSTLYKNLEIYGYGDEEFLDDISNYKDLGHYHYLFNSYMINKIQNNSALLNNKNIEKYLNTITKKAQNFDLQKLSNQFTKE